MQHIKQLDGLRFIAVFLVLIEHFGGMIGRSISAGYYGVNLFFVISGFLITTILLRSKEPFKKAYKTFMGRRTLRIFPIYYLTIFLLLVFGDEHISKYLIYCLTYTYNYIYHEVAFNTISHFWSLGVEEQFYLFWPFLILGLRNHLNTLIVAILLLVGICSLQLYFNIIPGLPPFGLVPQANALGIGAIGSIFFLQNKIPKAILTDKHTEFVVFIALFLLLISNLKIKFLVCPVISLFFVLKTAHIGFSIGWLNHFLTNKTITYIGTISYGIYLYHLPLGHYFTESIFDPFLWNKINWQSLGKFRNLQYNDWLIKLPLYSVLTIFLAHLSYKYLERPILTLKDKWFQY